MKIFITKYALSNGIEEVEAEERSPVDMKGYMWPEGYSVSFSPAEYALSRTEAELMAEEMRLNRIASLMKQIKKLEHMNFITYPK